MFELDDDIIVFNGQPIGRLFIPVGPLREQVEAAFAAARGIEQRPRPALVAKRK